MTILVTGATGFVGGHLLRALVRQEYRVRALARRSNLGLVDEAGELDIELALGDVTDPDVVQSAVNGVETIFHLAAQRDVWGMDESVYTLVNLQGTRHLLEAAVKARVQRFVYCSTVGVARYPGNLNADESLPYVKASSQVAYHQTKTQAEQEVLAAARRGVVPAVAVRPVITYGPGDRTGMVTQLLIRLAQGRFLPIGTGRNHVDLAYVDDVVKGILLAWQRGTIGEVYIFSSPRPVDMRTVLITACAAIGKAGPGPFYVPTGLAYLIAGATERVWRAFGGRPPITRDAVTTLTVDRGFSHSRAARELGYQPEMDLEEGLRKTVEWLYAAGLTSRP